jgi:hypothetical protein
MTKNPIINALAAALYIALVASLMFYGSRAFDHGEDTVMAPIAMISLLTLSAAMMGYLLLLQPLRLYLDGEKQRAVTLFLHTLASFAVITVLFFLTLFFFGA